MRTNIEIDDALMASAMQACGAKTKREVVEIALKELVMNGKQRHIRAWRGKLAWDSDLDAMRRGDAPPDAKPSRGSRP